MRPELFSPTAAGRVIRASGGYNAFVPHPLPPVLEVDWDLTSLLVTANQQIGLLSGLGRTLPNPHLLSGTFMRREAVLSSRIEGTRSTYEDLLLFEAAEGLIEHRTDTQEVYNYVLALEFGLARMRELPLSLRLIREVHRFLMAGVRGSNAAPGEFRTSQNWIGVAGALLKDATYVPPPVPEMHEALGALELYLHAPSPLPLLVRLALIHYQFEAIHPFLDGNGRVGRLLLTLLLCHEGALEQPLLNLSAFFEANRQEYYRLLLAVSTDGVWREWLVYFLKGVCTAAEDGVRRGQALLALREEYLAWAQEASSGALLPRIVDELFAAPVFGVGNLAHKLGKTSRAIRFQLERLLEAELIREVSGRQRGRVYMAPALVRVMED